MNNAIADLHAYAKKFNLEYEDLDSIPALADIMCLPAGVTAVATFSDGHSINIAAFVQDNMLKRFGLEVLSEDPDDTVTTTYEDLVFCGDPKNL